MNPVTVKEMLSSLMAFHRAGKDEATIAVFLAQVVDSSPPGVEDRLFATPQSALAWLRSEAGDPRLGNKESFADDPDGSEALEELATTGKVCLQKVGPEDYGSAEGPRITAYLIRRMELHG